MTLCRLGLAGMARGGVERPGAWVDLEIRGKEDSFSVAFSVWPKFAKFRLEKSLQVIDLVKLSVLSIIHTKKQLRRTSVAVTISLSDSFLATKRTFLY